MATLPEAVLENYTGQSYLRTNRLFYLDPAEGQAEGWYFKVRGPRLYGPYPSRDDAAAVLERMVSEYLASNVTGDR
jgi:hypothetical protein